MKDYTIITDSCCDLPIEYIENNNISYVSLSLRFMGKEYKDDFGKSLNYKEFYAGMIKGEIPKTSQPSPEDYCSIFRKILDQGKDILYICVSTGLSGTFNCANIAKNIVSEEYDNRRIEIVDILTASMGQGIMVVKALEMQSKGHSMDEVLDFLETNKLNLNTYITVDDLNHLKRGGRISSAAAIFGMVLHIKPILTLNNEGRVLPVIKVKGRKSALNKLAKLVCEKIENPEEQVIAISHGDVKEEAEKLKEIILKEVKVKDVIINHIGPVVGTYGGPGALAVFFIGKHRQNHVIEVNK
ncbi:DegV family protein [Hathewaya histolytica]|uniref:DegV family protein n=1 Tax=Hathewaya histolytica TaxID=1498 RepID=A0A4U9RFP6_HATHI|nr:DegV family protein [Hathewaya histolytica]VTQ89233.1 DegV family protein [Hathewaya histolytica]